MSAASPAANRKREKAEAASPSSALTPDAKKTLIEIEDETHEQEEQVPSKVLHATRLLVPAPMPRGSASPPFAAPVARHLTHDRCVPDARAQVDADSDDDGPTVDHYLSLRNTMGDKKAKIKMVENNKKQKKDNRSHLYRHAHSKKAKKRYRQTEKLADESTCFSYLDHNVFTQLAYHLRASFLFSHEALFA